MNADQPASTSLLQRGIGAVLWGSLGSVLRIALQIISQIILARILGPQSYGIFAVALTVVFFASMFADFGLAYGLIQRQSVHDNDIRYVFTWQVVLGLVMTVIVVALANPLAGLMGDPQLAAVLCWLSLGCLLAALGTTAQMLLRRNLDFKPLNMSLVISYAAGFLAVGIPMAVYGWGVWSLVAAYLVQMAVASAISYGYVKHAVRPLFQHDDRRSILSFGSAVLATNLLNWVMMSLDRLVIGAALQAAAAGIYSTMSNLMTAPVATLTSVFQSALYATSARAQDDVANLRSALIAMLGAVALFIAPIFFAVGTVAETLVLATYGPKWEGAGAVLRPLAFAMPAYLLMSMAIPTLWASGRTTWEFRLQLPLGILWAVVLVAVATTGSLQLISWTACLWFYVRAIVIVGAACRAIGLVASDALAPLKAGVVTTSAVMIVASAAERGLLASSVPSLWVLLVIMLFCGLAFVFTLWLASPLIVKDVRRLINGIAVRLPSRVDRVIIRGVLGISPSP